MAEHTPTQVTFPLRATLRSIIVATLALLPILPEIAHAAGVSTVPVVVTVLGVTAVIQRVIALPSVNKWLTRYLNLGAEPKELYHE